MNRARYLELLQPSITLMESKHEDYGNDEHGIIPLDAYFPFGNISYVQMLHIKTMRLVALTNGNKKPNHESVEDTVRDLINYSVFYLDFLNKEHKGKIHGV